MRSLKTLVVGLLTIIAVLASPALTQAATAAPVTTVVQPVIVHVKPKPGEICKRFKSGWKRYELCWKVMKVGGAALWSRLESIARQGWGHFRNHPTVKRHFKRQARALYCMLTLRC
ncbi:hypothetical protein SAMN05444920_106222 [Nonomuraea solani]|uniref:Uncharacterized protein n=1 Tax=Nonomuraea solani TaxID=1144553 RepID=A0A1H6DUS9_9ACTN|nr:hypothetical protein [Nonomuraea solani]SEG88325.1 hypothetical protein SAMN05444920_106222 [Nonomuraea solani]